MLANIAHLRVRIGVWRDPPLSMFLDGRWRTRTTSREMYLPGDQYVYPHRALSYLGDVQRTMLWYLRRNAWFSYRLSSCVHSENQENHPMKKKTHSPLDTISQFAIPTFTLGAQLALSMKYPEWALMLNILAQPFWLYSSWQSYKNAGQVGILITTLVFILITAAGIVNYWF